MNHFVRQNQEFGPVFYVENKCELGTWKIGQFSWFVGLERVDLCSYM